MGVLSTVQILSAVVFCTLIAASAAQSEGRSRVSWVKNNEASYHVSIWFVNSYMCSGTLIGYRDILTVAHCVVVITPEYYANMTVKTGSNNLDRGGEFHFVQSVTIHPNFTFSLNRFYSNDIAVIKLTDYVEMSRKHRGLILSSNEPADGTRAVVTGWARNSDPPLLRKAISTIISKEECQEMVNNFLLPNQFCTFDAPERNVCVANSGSPLVQNNKLVGMVVRAGRCGTGFPKVYVSIAPYRAYISQAMSQNN